MSDRREELVEATLRVIGRSGVDAVTHRAVAAEAGVPLAATTYYFGSKDELVCEALALVIDRSMELVTRFARVDGEIDCAQLVDRLTEFAEAQLDDQRAPLIAQFELMLEGARRSRLRPLAERWSAAYLEGLTALVGASTLPDPAPAAQLLSTLIEGALLDQLSLPRHDFVEMELRPMLTRAVRAMAAPTGRAAATSSE